MPKTLGYFFLVIGLLAFTFWGYLFWQYNSPNKIGFASLPTTQVEIKQTSLSTPIGIKIPRLGIDLQVEKKTITNGQWQDSKTGVAYWDGSPIPGQIGNSILYGHNWPNLLAKLPKTRPGDEIIVLFSDKTEKSFIVTDLQTVDPKNIEVLKASADTRITLYTCTGILDSQRFVVVAKPVPLTKGESIQLGSFVNKL